MIPRHELYKDNAIPQGVADFLPEQAERICFIENRLNRIFELWGFRRIITPLLEFEELLAVGMDETLREKSFRFEDRQSHRMLAIPPDITPQVARIETMRMSGYPLPHRLYYNGRVLRQVQLQSGRSREIFQAGVELIGLDSPEADAEMIAMSAEILRQLGFKQFKIDLGQVEFYRGIMASTRLDRTSVLNLQQSIARKDVSAVTSLLEHLDISDDLKCEIASLPRMFGGTDVLAKASTMVRNERSKRALDNLFQVVEILAIHGIRDELTIDLGEIRGLAYHSGVTFEGFVPDLGEPVCGGGRYDGLMGRYGRELPATGFAFNLQCLLQGIEKCITLHVEKNVSLLVFNMKDEKSDALELATHLRRQGCLVSRDIIRRDFDQSLEYARRMNIAFIVIIGSPDTEENSLILVRCDNGFRRIISRSQLMESGSALNFNDWIV
jgi:ATP phosphoribosyltransferase regulatory subunit